MAKVYIVSAGEYSDWRINKIFLNKEKAEAYHKICNDYDLNDIEEYDTSDDEVITKITYCECSYQVIDSRYSDKRLSGDYKFEIKYGNTADNKEEYLNNTVFYDNKIILKRVLHGEFDEDKVKDKYLKVCQDLSAFIRNEITVNGASDRDICELLKNKIID